MKRATLLWFWLAACTRTATLHEGGDESPERHTRRAIELDPSVEAELAKLAAAADASSEDFAAHKASGLAHMRVALSGVLDLRDRAEQDLEAAFRLDPTDRVVARSLGRFYNMRAVAGDTSKADMQVEVYAALLGDADPVTMSNQDFTSWSFFQLGRILARKDRGKNFEALALVEALEDQLATRVQSHPDDIELRALAGNFAFFFAGNIPLSRERRVREAVEHFTVVRTRWDEMRRGARDPSHCPNTKENFMFELAEGHLALGERDEAATIYEELGTIVGERTRAKELIAHVSDERLRNLDRYSGDLRLMPPWPSDVANCVVCHAWNAEVSLDSLWSLEPIRAQDVPSKARAKPIFGIGEDPAADGDVSSPP